MSYDLRRNQLDAGLTMFALRAKRHRLEATNGDEPLYPQIEREAAREQWGQMVLAVFAVLATLAFGCVVGWWVIRLLWALVSVWTP